MVASSSCWPIIMSRAGSTTVGMMDGVALALPQRKNFVWPESCFGGYSVLLLKKWEKTENLHFKPSDHTILSVLFLCIKLFEFNFELHNQNVCFSISSTVLRSRPIQTGSGLSQCSCWGDSSWPPWPELHRRTRETLNNGFRETVLSSTPGHLKVRLL